MKYKKNARSIRGIGSICSAKKPHAQAGMQYEGYEYICELWYAASKSMHLQEKYIAAEKVSCRKRG